MRLPSSKPICDSCKKIFYDNLLASFWNHESSWILQADLFRAEIDGTGRGPILFKNRERARTGNQNFKNIGNEWEPGTEVWKISGTRHRFSLIFGSGNGGGKRQGKSVGRIVGNAICCLGPGILGLVSLYTENQSKRRFHTYQSWISICLLLLILVR